MWRCRGSGKYLGYIIWQKYPFSITENKIKNKFIKIKENVHDKDSVCILSKFFVLFLFILFSFSFSFYGTIFRALAVITEGNVTKEINKYKGKWHVFSEVTETPVCNDMPTECLCEDGASNRIQIQGITMYTLCNPQLIAMKTPSE